MLAAAALITLLALFLSQGVLFDGGLTAVDEGRLLRIGHDDYVHVSVKVQELKANPPKTRTIYLFGGSGTMECIVSEASLAAQVGRDAKQPVQVVSLAAHQESMAMSLALVDNLPPGPATLAIGLAPIRVTGAPERDAQLLSGHTLLVRSKRLAQIAPKYFGKRAPDTGAIPGIFDYVGSYLRERAAGRAPWGTKIAYESHYYPWGATGHLPLGKRRNVLSVLDKDVKLYRKYADYNFAMLEEILKLARRARLRRGAVRPAAERVGGRPRLERRRAGLPQARPRAGRALRRALRAHRAPRDAEGRRLRRPLPPARAGAAQVAARDGARAGVHAGRAAGRAGGGARRADRGGAAVTRGAGAPQQHPGPGREAGPEQRLRGAGARRRVARAACRRDPEAGVTRRQFLIGGGVLARPRRPPPASSAGAPGRSAATGTG